MRLTRSTRFVLLGVSLLALAACDDEGDIILAPKVAIAYTRFINAVPDTGATDWRFYDVLENSPVQFGLPFRGFSSYQATGVGARKLRIFPTSTNINVTQQFLIDQTVTFEEGKYYSIIHVGNSRAGAANPDQLLVVEDVIAAPAAGNIAIRAVNLGTGLGSVDVFNPDTTTAALPAAPLFSNVAYLGATTYATMPVGRLNLRTTTNGTATVVASVNAPAGVAADPTAGATAIGGVRMAQSVITAYLFPRSVAGSAAPQTTAFQSPTIVYVVDKHPR
jgi:hypothetical protein